jgi:hypothetical protein
MTFNPNDCENKVWCGKTPAPPGKINGDPYSCLKKGFGRGGHTERVKFLDPTDLRTIPYITPTIVTTLNQLRIRTKADFISTIVRLGNPRSTANFLNHLVPDNPIAFNAIVMFLYNSNVNVKFLPACQ